MGVSPTEKCQITYVIVKEKWGIFPRDTVQFQALAEDGAIVAKSAKFELEGLNTMGPNRKNKKHRAAYEALSEKLKQAGWEECGQGELWFNVYFHKVQLPHE